jgi:hypothetical protein
MDISYIRKEQVIERYLDNKLSDKELKLFEIYFLEFPEILNEIEKTRIKKQSYKNKQ